MDKEEMGRQNEDRGIGYHERLSNRTGKDFIRGSGIHFNADKKGTGIDYLQ